MALSSGQTAAADSTTSHRKFFVNTIFCDDCVIQFDEKTVSSQDQCRVPYLIADNLCTVSPPSTLQPKDNCCFLTNKTHTHQYCLSSYVSSLLFKLDIQKCAGGL